MTIQNILLQKITDRQLKPASVKTYTTNFNKFLKDSKIQLEEIGDIDLKIGEIITFLDSLSNSKKRNVINPLLILLSNGRHNVPEENRNVYDLLNGILKSEIENYKKPLETQEFKQKEADNFMNYNEIMNKVDSEVDKLFLEYPTLKDFKKKPIDLTKLVITGLYTYIPPRRTIYALTKLISLNQYNKLSKSNLDSNVYLVHKNKIPILFHYGKDIVKSPTEENLTLDIQNREKLAKLLNYYLFNKKEYLFTDTGGFPINNNYFSKLIPKAFDKYVGKKLSVNQLRKFYSTSQSSEAYEQIQQDSEIMNHSVDTHLKVYTKRPIKFKIKKKIL